ncbi:MAG: hypothetical protein JWP11_437 [Frankiales bacterium]|jgi:hypothetical protein|nr:hypothetical protein [Frankiales bacterium]
MSDLFGTTSAATAPTTTYDRTGYEPTGAEHTGAGSPLSKVHVEEPRRHPLTYAALALSVLALLLAITALSRGTGNDVNRVRVGNNDCVSVAQDAGPNALYCRTGALPNG